MPYQRVDGHWVSASRGPNAQKGNAFGLRRLARLQNLEVEALVEQVPKGAWQHCEKAVASCFDEVDVPVTVRNTSDRPTLCGDIAIPVAKPVPWAWQSLTTTFFMPSRFVRMVVQC